MDILSELKVKATSLPSDQGVAGIRSMIRHIETAEKHLFRGRKENDENYFNDAIYRTNQAFEGMLKEAYVALSDSEVKSISTFQIEEYLVKNRKLTPRLVGLLTNYRQEWRNPSTHDHTLVFSEQEALLAIVSISAFATVLLDQIIESKIFKREKEEAERSKSTLKRTIENYDSLSFMNQTTELFILFSKTFFADTKASRRNNEIELIGHLTGFISAMDPNVAIEREPKIGEGMRPDLILRKGEETVVVELKTTESEDYNLDSAIDQVLSCMESGNLDKGLVFIPPLNSEQVAVGVISFGIERIVIVVPKKMASNTSYYTESIEDWEARKAASPKPPTEHP